MYKIRLQRHVLKLATNEWSDKTFLLTIYDEIWLQSAQWFLRRSCLKSVDDRQTDGRRRPTYPISSQMSLWLRWAKNQTSKRFFLNLQQMIKVTKCSCWHKNVVPKGLSAPALGLYTCIKSWKNVIKSDFKEIHYTVASVLFFFHKLCTRAARRSPPAHNPREGVVPYRKKERKKLRRNFAKYIILMSSLDSSKFLYAK